MRIEFQNLVLDCRSIQVNARKLKLNDLIEVEDTGNLLKVVTVQNDCPVWESNTRLKCAIVVESEDHSIIPVSDVQGTFHVYRPVKHRS